METVVLDEATGDAVEATGDAVTAPECPPDARPSEVTWRETAPTGSHDRPPVAVRKGTKPSEQRLVANRTESFQEVPLGVQGSAGHRLSLLPAVASGVQRPPPGIVGVLPGLAQA